ncbi:MAG: alkaline phosphatase family protein [Planctomycetota bacterium]|jgi:predicted AlkP superfamily pyrophosphatase or phosphodiesterase
MAKICIINVVGLTPKLAAHAPRISAVAAPKAWRSPLPAVTCTCQATMLTGLPPSQHGIVGNGWLHRETREVRFWQQSNSLMRGVPLYLAPDTAKLFWWFSQGAPVEWYATPKPHYGCDGSKVFDIIDETGCRLQECCGPFPFRSFWGPEAGLPSSEWIARASAIVMKRHKPELTLVYLPHLDYDYQRRGPGDRKPVAEVDACAGQVIDAAKEIDAKVVVVSEYGIVPVSTPVFLNRKFRRLGWLSVREGPYGEMLDTFRSKVFAVCDHQVAHIYVKGVPLDEVREKASAVEGVQGVVDPSDLELNHPRSGELVALAKPDAWFAYYYWLDDKRAPDFARTVDIHRKPGYDPCELFLASKPRALLRLAQKKMGFRYRMDVVPLNPSLVKGSHGLWPEQEDGPVIVGEDPPDNMTGFKDYVGRLLKE